ncbi:regulatory protein RecX [Neorhizobium sp. NPDC001467]|uniref:regulatory protein RecX n=1 Tax=Neorhizobium sp. NPDC001467 TaxID=3390595 RepID=UPI003D02CA95
MSGKEEEDQPIGVTPRMLSWAKNSTLYRLSRRMMSERELFDAIKRKAKQKFEDISEEHLQVLAATALEFGQSLGALNDQNYAETKVRSGVRSGRSKRMIQRKLQEKGIDSETASIALEDADDVRAALAYARKRGFGPYRRDEADERRITKELSSMARQGFNLEICRRVVALDRDEAEELTAGAAF